MEPIDIETENEATRSEEYPIATDDLIKGSTVSVEVIERAFGAHRDTKQYQLAAMRAAEYIARRFADRGEVVFVAQEKGALRILTDEEAPAYAAKLFREGMRKAGHAHARQLGADRSQMSDEVRSAHDRALEVQGRMLSAARKERRAPALVAAKRQTPSLRAVNGEGE